MEILVIIIMILAVALLFIIMLGWETSYMRILQVKGFTIKNDNKLLHSTNPVIGGGTVFYFSIIIFQLFSWTNFLPQQYNILNWAFAGITILALGSFYEDIRKLNIAIRLPLQLIASAFIIFPFLQYSYPWHYYIIGYLGIVLVLNMFRYMSKANGMNVGYTLAVLIPMFFVPGAENLRLLLIFAFTASLAFAFYNMRLTPKSLCGNVGSVTMGAIIIYSLYYIINETQNLNYLIFILVYAIDSVFSTIYKLIRRTDINANLPLYQLIPLKLGISPLYVSIYYAFMQLIFSLIFLILPNKDMQWGYVEGLTLSLSVAWVIFKIRFTRLPK